MRPRSLAPVGLFLALLVGCQAGPTPVATDLPTPSASQVTAPTPPAVGEEVTVGEYSLGGTLILPDNGKHIAVLLLAGSGPQDRDETLPSGSKPLRDIAEGLAAQGIASLRFDKRTLAAQASYDPATFTVAQEYLEDAAAGIALLQERLPQARIFVVGHSQGAMILPSILAANPSLAGGVSLAGTPRSLWEVIAQQNREALAANVNLSEEDKQTTLAEVTQALAQLSAIDSPDDPVPAPYNQSMGAAYIASLNAIDAGAIAQGLDVPLLFIQGQLDKQIYADVDYAAWQELLAGHSNVEFQLFDGLSHYFAPTTGTTAQDDLTTPGTVSPEVITAIATWLEAHATS